MIKLLLLSEIFNIFFNVHKELQKFFFHYLKEIKEHRRAIMAHKYILIMI